MDADLELAMKLSLEAYENDDQWEAVPGAQKDAAKAKKSVVKKCIDLTLDSDDDDEDEPILRSNAGPLRVKAEPQDEEDQLLDEDQKPSFDDQLAAIRAEHKRKSEAQGGSAKRQALASPGGNKLGKAPVKDEKHEEIKHRINPASNVKPERIPIAYPNGAIRLTKTQGRNNNPNAIGWNGIFVRKAIEAMYCHFFFIGQDEFYRHLPLGLNERDAEIIIGRDIGYDPERPTAIERANVEDKTRLAKPSHFAVAHELAKIYRKSYGPNYKAIYPFGASSAHSKLAAIKYNDMDGKGFLRVLITESNAMTIDWVGGSNRHFIQDFPQKTKNTPTTASLPITLSIKSKYNFTKAAGSLIPSQPGAFHGNAFGSMGIGRLRELALPLLAGVSAKELKRTRLEVCTASVGKCEELWLQQMWHLAVGKTVETLPLDVDEDVKLPPITIVYPTADSAKACDQDARDAASNMGTHCNYGKRAIAIKALFHDYKDLVPGRLTHQKSYLLLPSSSSTRTDPYYVVLGSANFSSGALGGMDVMKSGGNRLKLNNFGKLPLSILFRGEDVKALLADGARSWTEVMTYKRPAAQYNTSAFGGSKPWSSGAWGH
ncbi:hypothetical protein RQP46_007694 [Phenoliferia psychrophenolica]